MLEARMELDVKELELYGDKARAFRLSEGKAFAEAMRQKVATTLFYGDSNVNPDEFNGLSMRYPSLSSPNVIDAGGTGNNLTSMWFINWGSNTVHGLYPKGSTAGMKSRDLGESTTTDNDGCKFQVMTDLYNWDCGLAVRDWRAVVRIANIDTSKLLLPSTDKSYVNLQALTIKAKNKMPVNMRNGAVWYCNDEVMTALEMQSIDKGNVHLNYGEYFNAKAVPVLHGRPIRQCDVISNHETALVA